MEILGKNIRRGHVVAAATAVVAAGFAGYTYLTRDSGEKLGDKIQETTARALTDQERLDIVMKATSQAADRCAVVMESGKVAELISDGVVARKILITDAEPDTPSSISMRAEDCSVLSPAAKNSPFLRPGRDGSVEFTPTKVAGFTYDDYLDGDVQQKVAAVITWMQTRDPENTEARDGRSSTVNVHLSAGIKPETTFSFNFREFVPKDAECRNPDKPDVPAPPFPQIAGDFSCLNPQERHREEDAMAKRRAVWRKAIAGYRLQTERRVWGQLVVAGGRGAKGRPLKFGPEAMAGIMGVAHDRVAKVAGLGSSRRGKR